MNASAAMASTTSSSSVASLDLLTAALGKGMPPVTPRTSSRQGRQAKLIRRAMAAPDSDAVGLGEELQPVLDELSSRAEYILSGRVKKLRGNIRAVSSEFVCATCKKLFDAPRRLACGHVACLDCVDDSCSVCRKPTHPHRPATDIQDQFAALPCSCDLALCDWTGPLANFVSHIRNDCTMVPTRCLRGCGARLVRGMLAAHAAICAAPLQPPAAPTLSKTKSGRTASIDAQGDDNSDTEEEDVAPVPRKSSSRRPSKQLSGDGDRNSPTTSSTTDATMGELPGANRTESTSPRSRVVGDDVVLLRPETTVEELQSQLEETILRIHVLSRQHASTEHAMLDDDFGASERAELRGVLSELTAELSRQTEKKKGLERRLKKSGVELHSPTMRIVDHGGLLELDDGVELDTSSDDLDLHHEDSDDDGEDGAYPPYLRRARSSEDTRVPAGAGSKLALSISAQSVLKKKGSGSSLKERKNNQMSMSYIDRPTALPPVRRGERGPSLTGNALLPKRPEGQAPKPPA